MKQFILVLISLLATVSLQAKVTLPSFFSDNMVLQQKADVAVWGTSDGKKVIIEPSWTKSKTIVAPDSDGKWTAILSTPEAGGPYTLTIRDGKEKTVINNVMIGEVWFCSGQSNMVMSMRGFIGQPVEHGAEYILSATPSVPIRVCDIPNKQSPVPLTETEAVWKENTQYNAARFSATAYFFARSLYDELHVPIGIITADWGGTTIETWMSKEVIDRDFAHEFDDVVPEDAYPKTPSVLFNGMINPILPYTVKGFLWYQGEDNRLRPEQYTRLQPAYAAMLRDLFRNPDAPFYFVQIAPYAYAGKADSFASGFFYEAQQKTLALIPHSGIVPTLDLGEKDSIHPSKKLEVGKRLAWLALVNDYGYTGINPNAPSYKSVEFKDGEAIVTVENVEWMGLCPGFVPVGGFELAGEDKVFHPATGVANKYTITVSSDDVPAPVAVRYCFHNWTQATLFSAWGIPLLPFRTDNWEYDYNYKRK